MKSKQLKHLKQNFIDNYDEIRETSQYNCLLIMEFTNLTNLIKTNYIELIPYTIEIWNSICELRMKKD